MEVIHLRITARDKQAAARLMLYRWQDYEITIKQSPISTVVGMNWYEVTLVKQDITVDE